MNGILFKPDMHQAIREGGTKTVTRRLDGLKEINKEPEEWRYVGEDDGIPAFQKGRYYHHVKPRYHAGEVVYVKEAYAFSFAWEDRGEIYYKSDWIDNKPVAMEYHAGKWRPSLFMPAWAARDFIQITDVRPELFRLENLTTQELELEGGEIALKYLKEYAGKWLWRYEFKRVEKKEASNV